MSAALPAPHSRRQRVPPALSRGTERFEGLAVLDEVRDDVGLLLFRTLRNVLIWSQLPEEERASAFSPRAAQDRRAEMERVDTPPELLGPLSVFTELLAAPDAVDERRLALACRRVALWAEDRGALGTALDFSQAAAMVRPGAASLAYAVGRLARRRAEYDRAESWFTRAIIQGRQSGDWRAYATAFSGLGNLNLQRGNFPSARRAHFRCLRAALRHGLPELEANAYHDLFVTAYHSGEHAEADQFASRALAAYGPSHPQVARLAYDLAYNWVLQGQFAPALAVARALLLRFRSPEERVLVHGLIARAAGGAGDEEAFLQSAGEVRAAAGEVLEEEVRRDVPDTAAGALVGVAHGAASLGLWRQAEDAAERLSRIARERSEGDLVLMAEALLDAARRRQRTEAAAPAVPVPDAAVAAEFVSALSRQLVKAG